VPSKREREIKTREKEPIVHVRWRRGTMARKSSEIQSANVAIAIVFSDKSKICKSAWAV
jgi:hypothetical protein